MRNQNGNGAIYVLIGYMIVRTCGYVSTACPCLFIGFKALEEMGRLPQLCRDVYGDCIGGGDGRPRRLRRTYGDDCDLGDTA